VAKEPDAANSPSKAARKKDSKDALDVAMSQLSDRHRAVIRLRTWDRMSFENIGRLLGTSEDGARMLYTRALAKLRELMGPGHAPE
jgi:RNA polymerase sigma factor (sigma-70 family)